MFSMKTIPLLLMCAGLAACASSASPQDVKMALALSAQGKELLAQGKNAEARDIYESAVSRDERNARAWNGLGVAYDLLGKRDKAREAYERALDLAPKDMKAANNLAHLDIEEGNAAGAAKLLEPFAAKKNAPPALKQNLAKANKMMEAPQPLSEEPYADLGSYPTEGLAQGQVAKALAQLGGEKDVSFLIVPEVKSDGGTPAFTVKAVGNNPQATCRHLNPKMFTCTPHGKK